MKRLKVTSPMLELDERKEVTYKKKDGSEHKCFYTHGGLIDYFDEDGEPLGTLNEGFYTLKNDEIKRIKPKEVFVN